MPVMASGATPRRSRRRSVSVSFRPQSTSTRLLPASATRQLPPLPLASDAKRSNLLELLEEQREDAARRAGAIGHAVLVEDVDLGRRAGGLQLDAILLGLRLRAGAEQAIDEAAVLQRHLALR